MAVKREDVVENAFQYLKTPWVHGGRLKGVAIDCTGLVICTFNDSGADIEDMYDYSLQDEFPKLIRELSPYFRKKNKKPQPGDVLVFRGDDIYNHVGICVKNDGSFIHAYSVPSVMSVVVNPFDGYWRQRLKGVYVYKKFEVTA